MAKTLKVLADMLTDAKIIGQEDIEIKDIAHDSRKVTAGTLFVCIAGAHVDGHDFIDKAKAQGAVAIMTEREMAAPEGMAVLQVKDLSAALQQMVPFFYDYPAQKMRIVGITGTNGKTSISYMLRAMLRGMGCRVGLIGTIQIMVEDQVLPIHNTTPDVVELQRTLAMMHAENMDYVVMEVSSHALAQNRVAGVEFDTVVFTNLTQDHLDYHKTLENYTLAKAKLFQIVSQPGNVKNGKTAVVNIDDPAGQIMLEHADCRHITYAINKPALLQAENIEVLASGAKFDIKIGKSYLPLQLQITGIFNIYNVMAAVGAAMAEGVPAPIIRKVLEAFTAVPGRFELVRGGQDFAVIVDYAHTPDGLENILKTARHIAKKRIITVFGCGGDRDNTKRPIMGRIAAKLSDVIIATSDNPRSEDPQQILDMVVAGVEEMAGDKPHEAIIDRRHAIARAIELAEKDDIVIIAGKGHENYQILKDETIHFDDKEEARAAIMNKQGEK